MLNEKESPTRAERRKREGETSLSRQENSANSGEGDGCQAIKENTKFVNKFAENTIF